MKPDNTPGAITPEEKAGKLGISVEQFWRLDQGLAGYKLAGKFPKCGLHGREGCLHEVNSPCFWSRMKRRSPLKVPETLPDYILKQLENIKERRFILILGDSSGTKDVALYIHSKIFGFPEGSFQQTDCTSHTLEGIEIKGELLIPDVGISKGTFISIKYKDTPQQQYIQSSRHWTNFTLFLHNPGLIDNAFVLNAYSNLQFQHDNVMEKRNAHLIISVDYKKEDLTKDTLNLFKIIELETEQSKALDTPQAKLESESLNVREQTVFFDDKTNCLWFTKDRKTLLEPKDAIVLKVVIDIIKRSNCCRKEEVIFKVYNTGVGTQQRMPEKEAARLNSAISTINSKCKKELSMEAKLIRPGGVKMLEFSRAIEIREL